MASISIALSKGRIFDETAPLLARVGIRPEGDPETSRKLVIATNRRDLRADRRARFRHPDLRAVRRRRPRHRRASDVLVEHGGEGLYQPVDLGIARCRMVVAVPKGFDYAAPCARARACASPPSTCSTAREHFAAKGVHVDLIRLYGSMELAPLVGLADAIVDLVATGSTLRANDLVAVEEIMPISARLIVNQAALKTKRARLQPLIDAFAQGAQAMKLRRLSTRAAPASTPQLAALARYRGRRRIRSVDARRARDPRRRARARRRRGARVHAALRPRRAPRASPSSRSRRRRLRARSPSCRRAARGAASGARAHPRVPRAADAGVVGRTPRPTARGSASASRRSSASASTCPGGKAAYPSSVLMNAMPAKVAGVREIVMVSPRIRTRWCSPPRRSPASTACSRIGGAQAVARARLRHRDDPARRQDRRPGQRLRRRGEAPGVRRGRHRHDRRPLRDPGHLRRQRARRLGRDGPVLAGRARRARAGDPALARRALPRRGRRRRSQRLLPSMPRQATSSPRRSTAAAR